MTAANFNYDPWSVLALSVFICATGILLYTYIGYPMLLALIAAFRAKKRPEPGYCPSISVLIAAYNEAGEIARKIDQTLALEYPPDKLEVVVASDGSTDRTAEIVEQHPDPRVRVVRVPRGGKTNAQNEGVKHCRGDIVVFSDATAVYHRKALLYLACNYEDPTVGATSGRYKYFDPNGESPTGLGSAAFWNYENFIKRKQADIRTLTGCSGCIYSVRRGLYSALPPNACSDLVEPLYVVNQGYRVAFEDRALAYEETTKSTGDEFGMRIRVASNGMDGILGVRHLKNLWHDFWIAFQLISHKVLRWMVPVLLLIIFASTLALVQIAEFRVLLVLQLAFYAAALFSMLVPIHRRWKLLGLPLYFCTLNAAALVSMIEVMRGKKRVLWDTVRR